MYHINTFSSSCFGSHILLCPETGMIKLKMVLITQILTIAYRHEKQENSIFGIHRDTMILDALDVVQSGQDT